MSDNALQNSDKAEISTNVNDVPDWMLEDGQAGTESMSAYVQPPRLLICQPTSKEPINQYDLGTPLIMPNEIELGKYDKKNKQIENPIIVVPIMFWPEFVLANPRSVHATHGSVQERSLDPQSEIAALCRQRTEIVCPHDESKMQKYQTRLNFMLALTAGGSSYTCLVQFKSAEYRTGASFNSLIKARKRPIFGCQFAMGVTERQNDKGNWFGFTFQNPPEGISSWVQDRELYEGFKKTYEELSLAASEDRIDTSEETVAEYEVDTESDTGEFNQE